MVSVRWIGPYGLASVVVNGVTQAVSYGLTLTVPAAEAQSMVAADGSWWTIVTPTTPTHTAAAAMPAGAMILA